MTQPAEPPDLRHLPPALAARLDRVGKAFLAEFLEVETRLHPGNLDALAELGHVYTRLGRYADGLELDRRLVRLVPDNPTVRYNLACSLCLLGRRDEALDALEAAVELGFHDAGHAESDDDLADLREDPRFRRLLAGLRG